MLTQRQQLLNIKKEIVRLMIKGMYYVIRKE